jgi:hypothetical protein
MAFVSPEFPFLGRKWDDVYENDLTDFYEILY